MSVTRLAGLIRARAVSPVEVVEAHLRRIESVNPRLNAVVTLAPDALEVARGAEAGVMRGEALGSLHGVPLTVKDTIDVRGMRATCGSPMRADYVPEADAPAVARMRAAGAIILGKTNCPEFALDYTSENPVFGRTNNPHDLERTPGGSSGGCAAAVAACMTAASLGSDLAGSVRIPAHFCGVAALKPTARRIPGEGHTPPLAGLHSLGASLGPLAREVKDLRLLFQVLASIADASTVLDDKASDVDDVDVSAESLKRLRVAWYADDGAVPVSEETRGAVRDAAHALKDAGLSVVEEVPPGVGGATELWLSLFEYATQRFVRRAYEGREDEAGRAARVILERAKRWGEPAFERVLTAWDERDRVRASLLGWMEHTPIFIAPVGAVPAFLHQEYGRVEFEGHALSTFRAFSDSHAANVFDLPAVCVPARRTSARLPIGVQIVGRPFEEERVLAAARIIERALGGWQRPPAESLPNANPNPL
ncbi:MAG: amidase [Acidobacteriota bacterium]|jgi:Asp-tRNA(Asn)/Glu-tRNA(Gln) amidotransferase A subunit family amidase|nr:amidase [Acidobacteriota bacterium]